MGILPPPPLPKPALVVHRYNPKTRITETINPRTSVSESLIQKYAKEFDKKYRKDFDSYDISDYVSGKLEYINKNLQKDSGEDSYVEVSEEKNFPEDISNALSRAYANINGGRRKCMHLNKKGKFCNNNVEPDSKSPLHCKRHANKIRIDDNGIPCAEVVPQDDKPIKSVYLEFDDTYFIKTGGLGAGSMLLFLLGCLVVSPLLSCFISLALFIVADCWLVMVPARKKALELNKKLRLEELKEMEPEWDKIIEEHDKETKEQHVESKLSC